MSNGMGMGMGNGIWVMVIVRFFGKTSSITCAINA